MRVRVGDYVIFVFYFTPLISNLRLDVFYLISIYFLMDFYNIICFQASELPIVFIERERLEVHMFAFTVDTLEDNEKTKYT